VQTPWPAPAFISAAVSPLIPFLREKMAGLNSGPCIAY
jgi:hypothetical protein